MAELAHFVVDEVTVVDLVAVSDSVVYVGSLDMDVAGW